MYSVLEKHDRDTAHTNRLFYFLSNIFACGKMTLLSFIFTSLPMRLAWIEGNMESKRERDKKKRKEKCLRLHIRYKGESLILGWGINEASAGYDSTVSDGEELCRPLGSASHYLTDSVCLRMTKEEAG